MLKIGDKVRIRNDLVIGSYYNNVIFVKSMSKHRGKVATIIDAYPLDCYKINLDNCLFLWSDDMLEPIDEYYQNYIDEIADLKEFIKEQNDYLHTKYTVVIDGLVKGNNELLKRVHDLELNNCGTPQFIKQEDLKEFTPVYDRGHKSWIFIEKLSSVGFYGYRYDYQDCNMVYGHYNYEPHRYYNCEVMSND